MNTQLSFSPVRVKTSPAWHRLANIERFKHGDANIVKWLGGNVLGAPTQGMTAAGDSIYAGCWDLVFKNRGDCRRNELSHSFGSAPDLARPCFPEFAAADTE
jgi:hypothetical protein